MRYLSPAGLWYCVLGKRVLDVTVSSVALLTLALPMLIIGLLVRMTSRGPAVFVQDRVGKDERLFRMLKFRSMETLGARERRMTGVGRLLRRFSVDELPQLLNVLRGEMSLVGPRPLVPGELGEYQERERSLRQSVAPGLTGLAQLEGRRDLSPEERIRYDLEYVRNWTLSMDLRLLLQTGPVVLRGRGAY